MSDIDQKILPFEEFVVQFEQISGAEQQLRQGLKYMRSSLCNKTPPYFKGFWEVRKLCFPLFKEKLDGTVRSELWNLYTELTREGRELKNMLDQETTFAVEQIDLAVTSLEKKLVDSDETVARFSLPEKLKSLSFAQDFYCDKQTELNRLNLFAARVNSLRKELAKTEMRVRHKNKFFQRLSALGDGIFPRRKELIREISEKFEEDVAQFAEQHFSEKNFSPDKVRQKVFFFREEIKQLQSCAKLLTINTHAFSTTRERLSQCWDKLRGMEKDLKKEVAAKRAHSSEVMTDLQKHLGELSAKLPDLELDDALRAIKDFERELERVRLMRDDQHFFVQQLTEMRAPLERQRHDRAEAVEKERLGKLTSFREKLASLAELSAEQMEEGIALARKELLFFAKAERVELEKQLRSLTDKLAEKKEAALLALSADDRASLEALESLLEQRREQRREIKEKLEGLRKLSGGSALDIEKAMEISEQAEAQKERLSKCDQAILDVEQKIEELKRL